MSEIKRKELKLEGATEVSRLHPDQLKPPEMAKLRNGVVSRSDLVPGIRPDFKTSSWFGTTRSGDWQGSYAGEPDFLNRMIWSFTNDGPVLCSRMWPFRTAGGLDESLAPTYTTGTVTTNATDRRILAGGGGTAWLQEVWPGCWFGSGDGSGNLHLVVSVDADDALTLDSDPGTLSGSAYTIFKTWHPDAGLWPVKVERFITSVIAGPVVPVAPIDVNMVCGPFHSDAEEPQLASYEWKEQYVSAAGGEWLWAMAAAGAVVVVVGSNGCILYSTGTYADSSGFNFFTWTKDSGTGAEDFHAVAVIHDSGGPDYLMAVGTGGAIYTAPAAGTPWSVVGSGVSDDFNGVGCSPNSEDVAIVVGDGGVIRWTNDNGLSWSTIASGTTENLNAITCGEDAAGTDYAIVVGDNGVILRAVDASDAFMTSISFSAIDSGTTEDLNAVASFSEYGATYDEWLIAGDNGTVLYSDDNVATVSASSAAPSNVDNFRACNYLTVPASWYLGYGSEVQVSADGVGNFEIQDVPNNNLIMDFIQASVGGTSTVLAPQNGGKILYSTGLYEVEFTGFEEISDAYRAHAFCQAGGYMVYAGMYEWDSVTSAWLFKPRRVRWAAPGTIADFASTGAGWVDLSGTGQILDVCSVGNSIIVGETDRISTLTPGVSSTWDHRLLAEGLWQLSNLLEVNEVAYFAGSDGLLYGSTPAGVQRVDSGFDLSVANDWEVASSSPIAISYSPSLQALMIFRVADPYKLHLIEPEGGQHAVWELPEITAGGNTYTPAMVSNLRTSAEDRLIIGYAETDTQSVLLTVELDYGAAVRGLDNISSDDEGRWHMAMQSGLLRFGKAGETVDVKDVEVHTWCAAAAGVDEMDEDQASFTAPDVAIEVRSKEDSEWRSQCSRGTISVGTSSCVGTGTAFSHKIGEGTAGGKTVYDTPCRAAKALLYTETGGTYTQVTAFTVSGTHEITFTTAPTDGHGVYVFWSGAPEVTASAGDMVRTSEGLHRVTAVDDAWNLTLDYYPTTTLTGTLVKAQQMDEGRGILTFGIGAKVEEMELRAAIVPRNASDAAAHARIVKLVIAYVGADEESKTDE